MPAFRAGEALPASEGILIAVPDSAIPACAEPLALRLPKGCRVALHTSGLLPANAIAAIARRGVAVASFHPLVSFATPTGALVPLAGVLAAIEGEAAATRESRRLARALGMRPFHLKAELKPQYHAAAALAANLTHVLVATATDAMTKLGLPRRGAAAALRPLVGTAIAAALSANGLERLTGPLARGDAQAVLAHLAALPPSAAAAYRAVATLALPALSSQHLVDPIRLLEIERALTKPRRCARFRPSM